MANNFTVSEGCRKYSLDTTSTGASGINVGDVSEGGPSTVLFHVKVGGASPGSFKIYRALVGSGFTDTDRMTPPYYNESSPSVEIAGGTSITAAGIYSVVADRSRIWIDYTSGADGMTVAVVGCKV